MLEIPGIPTFDGNAGDSIDEGWRNKVRQVGKIITTGR